VSIETSSCAAGSFKDRGIIDFQSLMINHLRFSLRSFFVPVSLSEIKYEGSDDAGRDHLLAC
jgi:hypothetical protein